MLPPDGPSSSIADALAQALAARYAQGPPVGTDFHPDQANAALLQAYLASQAAPQAPAPFMGAHMPAWQPAAAPAAPVAPSQGGMGGEGAYAGDDYAHAGWGTAQPYDYAGANDPYGGGYQHANQAPVPSPPVLPNWQRQRTSPAIDALRNRAPLMRHGF